MSRIVASAAIAALGAVRHSNRERGGIGRRARFRSWFPLGSGGSTPFTRIALSVRTYSSFDCFVSPFFMLLWRKSGEKLDLMNSIAVKVWTQAGLSSSLGPANLVFCINLQENRLGKEKS